MWVAAGFWIPANAQPGQDWLYLESVSIRDMIKTERFKARHVLVVSDSSYSAALFRDMKLPETGIVPEYVRQAPILGVLEQAGAERGAEFVFVRRRGAAVDQPAAKPVDAADLEGQIAAARARQEDLKKAKDLFDQLQEIETAATALTAEAARTRARLWEQYIEKFGSTDYGTSEAKAYLEANRNWKTPAKTEPPKPAVVQDNALGAVKKRSEDGRYTLYECGVIYDSTTKLEWLVGPDKGASFVAVTEWVKECQVAGGHWRMPTRDELRELWQKGNGTRNIDPVFETTAWWVWAAESGGSSSAWYFGSGNGSERSFSRDLSDYVRVFAIRSRR